MTAAPHAQPILTPRPPSPGKPPGDGGRVMILEALRGAAASYVLVHHLGVFGASAHLWYKPFVFGQEAVILFFLLSGFVIYMATERSPGDRLFRNYFIKRARRIYPVFLVALAVGYAGKSLSIGSPAPSHPFWLLGNVLMLQDLAGVKDGVWIPAYYNVPLWSLSYEWWFYMLFFPCYRLIRPERRRLAAFALSLAGTVAFAIHPNGGSYYLAFFAIWWSGAEMAREYVETGAVTFRHQWPSVASLLALTLIWAALTLGVRGMPLRGYGNTPFVQIRQYLAAVAMILIGIGWRNVLGWRGFRTLFRPFVWVAPISYAFYATHLPILTSGLCAGLVPEPLRAAGLIAVAVALAYLLEVRLQRVVNRVTARLLIPIHSMMA